MYGKSLVLSLRAAAYCAPAILSMLFFIRYVYPINAIKVQIKGTTASTIHFSEYRVIVRNDIKDKLYKVDSFWYYIKDKNKQTRVDNYRWYKNL